MNAPSQLAQAFRLALGLPEDTDVTSLVYRGIEEWDSVAHMTLVARLELTYDIAIDTDDVIDMSSYVECVRILGKYGVSLDS